MKTKSLIAAALSALLSSIASAQLGGSLTPPPGMPAVGMKTLDQAEPRIPLVSGAAGVTVDAEGRITISQPGSYYLTGNLTIASGNGIVIAANNVTLDLSGYTIGSSANCTSAIDYSGMGGIVVRNGQISGNVIVNGDTASGTGFTYGIYGTQPASGAIRVTDLTVRGLRDRAIGVGTDDASVVERCIVESAGGMGIVANTIVDCVVRQTLGNGIYTGENGSVSGSYAQLYSTGDRTAIYAYGATVTNSRGLTAGSGHGINCRAAVGSQGTSKSGAGIYCDTAEGSIGTSTSYVGLRAQVATHCQGTSTTSTGLMAYGTASFCRGILTTPGATAMTAGIAIGCSASGGAISSTQKHLGTP